MGPRTSKSYSLSKEPGNIILRGYCRAKRFKDFGLSLIMLKAHAEKEELLEDE